MACEHNNFAAKVVTVRNEALGKLRVNFMLDCADCGQQFSFGKPFISSTDGLELTAEIIPGARKVNKPLSSREAKELATWQQ